MTGPAPAVACVRLAVRQSLADVEAGTLVLVACSGGADSLALAAAAAFEGKRAPLRVGAVTVDHGLQAGSAGQAAEVARVLYGLGLDPVEVITVVVGPDGGPEAAARTARYAGLDDVAERTGAAVVLLGHTLDDQAETVLLGLARGSGARSLSGMAAVSGRYRRPLLDVPRTTTRQAVHALGLVPWDDPHNVDSSFARVRVRHKVLPVLEKQLGPGVTEALARTAALLRADADALDGWAEHAWNEARLRGASAGEGGLDVPTLAALPTAVRRRVLRSAAIAAGARAGALAAVHVQAVDELITSWHGQAGVDLPGGVRAHRACDRLCFGPAAPAAAGPAAD